MSSPSNGAALVNGTGFCFCGSPAQPTPKSAIAIAADRQTIIRPPRSAGLIGLFQIRIQALELRGQLLQIRFGEFREHDAQRPEQLGQQAAHQVLALLRDAQNHAPPI